MLLKAFQLFLWIVLLIASQAFSQQPEPTPGGEVPSATGGALVEEATPQPTHPWPSHGDSLLFHVERTQQIEDFKSDLDEIESAIHTDGLADAWLRSGSALSVWSNHPDYIELLETLEKSYGYLSPVEIDEAYSIRLGLLSGESPDCFVCMDAGLMALSTENLSEAESCFRKASNSLFYANHPAPRIMVARTLLKQGQLSQALAEYDSALEIVNNSGADPTSVFRVRYARAHDLFDNGYVEESRQWTLPSLTSGYLMERLWALTREVDYAWCKELTEVLPTLVEDLELLFQVAEPREDLLWEHGHKRYAEKVLSRIKPALEGDPLSRLIMDQQSLEWEYDAGNFEAVADRLRPWVEEYPMSQYDSWEPEWQEWVSWAHWTYAISMCSSGHPEEAEVELESIINNMPFEHQPRKIVYAWCWLGYALGQQHRYTEGVEAYETGLALDVQHLTQEQSTTPFDFLQPRVRGGVANPDIRAGFVKYYSNLLEFKSFGPVFEMSAQIERRRQVR